MEILKYTQNWDYHYQHHITIILDGKCAASGYISETADDVTITGIYVDEAYRRKGYGRIITQELMKRVTELMFNEVWLMVKKSNTHALKMYQESGFAIEKDAGHGAYYWMKWKKEE